MYKIKQGDQTRESLFYLKDKAIGSANIQVPVFIAPANCVIRKISFATDTAIARSDTNYEQIYFYDKGSAGTDSNVIISGTTGNTISGGTVLGAYKEIDMVGFDTAATALNSTHKYLTAGDVVTVATISGGTGVAFGHSLIKVVYELTDLKNRAQA